MCHIYVKCWCMNIQPQNETWPTPPPGWVPAPASSVLLLSPAWENKCWEACAATTQPQQLLTFQMLYDDDYHWHFRCNICGKRFSTTANCSQHMTKMHMVHCSFVVVAVCIPPILHHRPNMTNLSSPKRWNCLGLGENIICWWQVEELQPRAGEDGIFRCLVCGMEFYSLRGLRAHYGREHQKVSS